MLDPDIPKHRPQNRGAAASKQRRDGKHCPLCLTPLAKVASRNRRRRSCTACQAHPSHDKTCRRCGAHSVWENKDGAACQACGVHGTKDAVIHSKDDDGV
jgi:hypothetical protein